MSFFDTPDYESVEMTAAPEKAAIRDVSAASQAAATSQRERARQRRGLAASILTGPSVSADSTPASGQTGTAGRRDASQASPMPRV